MMVMSNIYISILKWNCKLKVVLPINVARAWYVSRNDWKWWKWLERTARPRASYQRPLKYEPNIWRPLPLIPNIIQHTEKDLTLKLTYHHRNCSIYKNITRDESRVGLTIAVGHVDQGGALRIKSIFTGLLLGDCWLGRRRCLGRWLGIDQR